MRKVIRAKKSESEKTFPSSNRWKEWYGFTAGSIHELVYLGKTDEVRRKCADINPGMRLEWIGLTKWDIFVSGVYSQPTTGTNAFWRFTPLGISIAFGKKDCFRILLDKLDRFNLLAEWSGGEISWRDVDGRKYMNCLEVMEYFQKDPFYKEYFLNNLKVLNGTSIGGWRDENVSNLSFDQKEKQKELEKKCKELEKKVSDLEDLLKINSKGKKDLENLLMEIVNNLEDSSKKNFKEKKDLEDALEKKEVEKKCLENNLMNKEASFAKERDNFLFTIEEFQKKNAALQSELSEINRQSQLCKLNLL